ncbi:cytokine receptor family member b8 precursor [Silurus asotus]|uniref:Cytokine receptor family member b8 n=1 Tax=Silurus asotus TaxID=30991 RepID=A0AAD5A0E4_SILAS|nr:cytokine receptor family member b8 precursor [Silurus asotus]
MFKPIPLSLCLLLAVLELRSAEDLAAPRNVRFHSVNLKNTVHWSPGTADAPDPTYTLEYAIYGDASDMGGATEVVWRRVEQCTNINQTDCDVTEQTGDTEEDYYVRVRANRPNGCSEWTETERLKLTDTILGPPLVNVSVVENKLQVKLNGPFRWRKTGKKRQSMFNIFPHMMYNISVYINRSKHTLFFLTNKKLLQHGPLEYNSEYCVKAEVFSQSLILSSVPSKWTCVSTADDPVKSQMQLLMLGGVIPTAVCLFVLATVCSFAYYYIFGHKPRLPKSVQDINAESKLQMFQPEKHQPSINVIIINSTNLSTGESKFIFPSLFHSEADVLERLLLVPVEGPPGAAYASQNVQQTSEAPSAGLQSSHESLKEDYGLVRSGDPIQVPCSPYNPQAAPGGDNSYIVQTGAPKPEQIYEDDEEEEETEEMQTICTWVPDTGQLQLDFPLLSMVGSETTETTKRNGDVVLPPSRPVLTSVVVKQASEESLDNDLLLKMEQDWDLQVQSTSE